MVTERSRVNAGRAMAAFAVVSAIAGCLWLVLLGRPDLLMREWVIHNAVVAVGFGVITWLVIRNQPRNTAVWVLAWTALFTGLYSIDEAVVFQMAANAGIQTDYYLLSPAEAPTAVALAAMQLAWLYLPLFLALSVAWLLFPDGKPPSPRWRWLSWVQIGFIASSAAGIAWAFRPSSTIPYAVVASVDGAFRDMGPLVGISQIGMVVMIPISLAGLVMRFRRSTGAVRQQFRWVVWGASVAGLVLIPAIAYSVLTRVDALRLPLLFVLGVLVASYGVAIGKYRLYDVDVVISKTLVYVSLALFIAGVYVGVVVGAGYLLGAHDEPNPWLGLLATVVVAMAFQPLRRRVQRIANRIVYGRRATPYEVLSTFSQRVSAVDPDVLSQIARSLVEGTTADGAAVWMLRGDEIHRIASWPPDDQTVEHVAITDPLPHADQVASVVHDGERLGVVALRLGPGQPFPPTDAHLLEQVAGGLGLALRNLLLTEDLRARVEELQESRRRIVTVQDQTRRRLERDLHDGAQQQLVALKIELGMGVAIAEKKGLDDMSEALGALRTETDDTIDALRDFARGIYPPLLESEGLRSALLAQTRKMTLPVTVQAAGVGRYPKEMEATVYFCVLEALQNVAKHAFASSAQVTIDDREDQLTFEVRDDGAGFDTGTSRSGLINMADRMSALGGELSVDSAPGRGTVVSGVLPVTELVLS